jgi:hypothetical protein
MGRVGDTLGGLWELLVLVVRSRFRLRGPYWRWRHETAFGARTTARPTRWRQLSAMLGYGRWVHQMKRGRWN